LSQPHRPLNHTLLSIRRITLIAKTEIGVARAASLGTESLYQISD
jgi:hypothetical protein